LYKRKVGQNVHLIILGRGGWVHYYWGHFWPFVPAPDDDGRWWLWSSRCSAWQGKQKYWEKTCPSAALSTTNPIPDLGSNPVRRGGMPATNRLSYGTARSSSDH
jgi:hypothetical protein